METQTFYRLIEEETPIIPEIAAETVVGTTTQKIKYLSVMSRKVSNTLI